MYEHVVLQTVKYMLIPGMWIWARDFLCAMKCGVALVIQKNRPGE
jgi:hypothetical protein